jgi:hypothetical protein
MTERERRLIFALLPFARLGGGAMATLAYPDLADDMIVLRDGAHRVSVAHVRAARAAINALGETPKDVPLARVRGHPVAIG